MDEFVSKRSTFQAFSNRGRAKMIPVQAVWT
jgi:hypothetical protein